MTQSPFPPDFRDPQQPPLGYYGSLPENNARKHVRLAVIFNYISVALDVCLSMVAIGSGVLFYFVPDALPKGPDDPPAWFFTILYPAIGIMAAIFALFKGIGTWKLQKRSPKARGWGLAMGILGCVQLLACSCCFLQVAAGIYTIVVMCFDNVRAVLASADPPASPTN